MAAFLDLCRFVPTTGGTTDWTFSSAVGGCQSPTAANAVNGTVYKFIAISNDLTQWEITEGAYNSTGAGSFARTTVLYSSSGTGTKTPGQSGAGTKINFSTVPQVAIIGVKEDLIAVEEANAFTSTQQGQARENIGAFGKINVQKFTTSGTYTPSANLLYAEIECIGAGGGSGGSTGSSGFVTSGGGGGGGAYSKRIATAGTIGASQTVTVGAGGSGGAGGATSVGTLCSAAGGGVGATGTSGSFGTGGAGGAAASGTGDVTVSGQNGSPGFYSSSVGPVYTGGDGGGTHYGPTTIASPAGGGATANGNAGALYGSGAAGGVSNNVASNSAGATGGAGIVIITEYCAA